MSKFIITRTPFRVSFFGGGTDFPDWYNHNGGSVISATIYKHSYVAARILPKIFNFKYRIRYYEPMECNNINQIKDKRIKEIIKYSKISDNLDITHHGDLPNLTGMGTSSSFTVGLLHALYGLQNKMVTKRELANSALEIEQKILKESVGSQDQIAASFGGFNKIVFKKNGLYECNPILLSNKNLDKIQKWTLLVYTGIQRLSGGIEKNKIKNLKKNKEYLSEMMEILQSAEKVIYSKNINMRTFGSLLNDQWNLKKKLSKKVSSNKIERIYNNALSTGATGGKLLGSGAGGFFLFIVNPSLRQKVINKLKLQEVDFQYDFNGSCIIYNQK